MKSSNCRNHAICVLGVLCFLAPAGVAWQQSKTTPAPAPPPAKPAHARVSVERAKLILSPPKGTKGRLAASGARSEDAGDPTVFFPIAPPLTGPANSAVHACSAGDPVVYWYSADVIGRPVEFTVLDIATLATVIEDGWGAPVDAGLHRIALKEYGASLTAGRRYAWDLALVNDGQSRSKDRIVSGEFEVKAPGGAACWYDQFDSTQTALDSDPTNAALLMRRRALLQLVGLEENPAGNPAR